MTVEVVSLSNQYAGDYITAQNLHMQIDGEDVHLERTILPNQVIVVAHDLVNDKVVLVEKYRPGALSVSADFPQDFAAPLEAVAHAAPRILKEATGLEAKSLTKVHSLMTHMDTTYAPVHIYYATVDTRPVINEPPKNIRLMSAKEMIKEVRWGNMNGMGVTLGANYIKSNRPRG